MGKSFGTVSESSSHRRQVKCRRVVSAKDTNGFGTQSFITNYFVHSIPKGTSHFPTAAETQPPLLKETALIWGSDGEEEAAISCISSHSSKESSTQRVAHGIEVPSRCSDFASMDAVVLQNTYPTLEEPFHKESPKKKMEAKLRYQTTQLTHKKLFNSSTSASHFEKKCLRFSADAKVPNEATFHQNTSISRKHLPPKTKLDPLFNRWKRKSPKMIESEAASSLKVGDNPKMEKRHSAVIPNTSMTDPFFETALSKSEDTPQTEIRVVRTASRPNKVLLLAQLNAAFFHQLSLYDYAQIKPHSSQDSTHSHKMATECASVKAPVFALFGRFLFHSKVILSRKIQRAGMHVAKSLRRSTAAICGEAVPSTVLAQLKYRQSKEEYHIFSEQEAMQRFFNESVAIAKSRFLPLCFDDHCLNKLCHHSGPLYTFLESNACSKDSVSSPLSSSYPYSTHLWPRAFKPQTLFEMVGHDDAAFELYGMLCMPEEAVWSRELEAALHFGSDSLMEDRGLSLSVIILSFPSNVGGRRFLELVCYACYLYPIYEEKIEKNTRNINRFFKNTYGLKPISVYDLEKIDKGSLQEFVPRQTCIFVNEMHAMERLTQTSSTMVSSVISSSSAVHKQTLLDLLCRMDNVKMIELQPPTDLAVFYRCHAIADSVYKNGISESSIYQLVTACKSGDGPASFQTVLNRLHFTFFFARGFDTAPSKVVSSGIGLVEDTVEAPLGISLLINTTLPNACLPTLLDFQGGTCSTAADTNRNAITAFDLSIQRYVAAQCEIHPFDRSFSSPYELLDNVQVALQYPKSKPLSTLLSRLSNRNTEFLDTTCAPLYQFDTLYCTNPKPLSEGAPCTAPATHEKALVAADLCTQKLEQYVQILECFSLFSQLVYMEAHADAARLDYQDLVCERQAQPYAYIPSSASSSSYTSHNWASSQSSLNTRLVAYNSASTSHPYGSYPTYGAESTSMGGWTNHPPVVGLPAYRYYPHSAALIGDLTLSLPLYLQYSNATLYTESNASVSPTLDSKRLVHDTGTQEPPGGATKEDEACIAYPYGTSWVKQFPTVSDSGTVTTNSQIRRPHRQEMRKRIEKCYIHLLQTLEAARRVQKVMGLPMLLSDMKRNERCIVYLIKAAGHPPETAISRRKPSKRRGKRWTPSNCLHSDLVTVEDALRFDSILATI